MASVKELAHALYDAYTDGTIALDEIKQRYHALVTGTTIDAFRDIVSGSGNGVTFTVGSDSASRSDLLAAYRLVLRKIAGTGDLSDRSYAFFR